MPGCFIRLSAEYLCQAEGRVSFNFTTKPHIALHQGLLDADTGDHPRPPPIRCHLFAPTLQLLTRPATAVNVTFRIASISVNSDV